jgi:hypothetical protein
VISAAPDAKLRRHGGADALSYFPSADTVRRQENTIAMNRRMAAIARRRAAIIGIGRRQAVTKIAPRRARCSSATRLRHAQWNFMAAL